MQKNQLKQVIFVDDQEEIHAIANMVFKKFPEITFELIKDPTLVLTEINKVRPQLIIMDWQMPMMDGLVLLHEIRKLYPATQLKVFILTGESRTTELQKIKGHGADLVIEKGNGLRSILSKIPELYENLNRPA